LIGYVLKRLLGAIPTLLVVIALSFLLMRLAPGGPFDEEQALPAEIRANLERAYGLDQPLYVQLGRYVRGLARGDFGPSFKFKDFSVTELIATGLPVSLELGAAAMLLAVLLGCTAAQAFSLDAPEERIVRAVDARQAAALDLLAGAGLREG